MWIIGAIALVLAGVTFALSLREMGKSVTTKPGEIELPTAQEGAVLPVVFGQVTLKAPIIVDVWDRYTTRIMVNSDGTLDVQGQTGDILPDIPGYEYFCSLHLLLCHGKVDAILGLYYGGKSVWTGRSTNGFNINTYGREPGGGGPGLYGGVEFHQGAVNTATGPDAGIVSNRNHHQIGPQYYGVASVVYIGDIGTSPQMPPMAFAVERIATTHGGSQTPWYPEKSTISIGRGREDTWKYLLQAASDETLYNDPEYDDSAWLVGQGGIGNAPVDVDMSLKLQNYWLPPVKTCIHGTPNFTYESGNERWVAKGMAIWMRYDLGPMPEGQDFGVRCWSDDVPTVWFNGTEILLDGLTSQTQKDFGKWNTLGRITADLVVPEGPNVIAYRVRDSFADNGTIVGDNKYIYAGIQVGPYSSNPEPVRTMNAAHMIYEVLTDPVIGRGYPTSDLDDTAFRAFADALYGEYFGLCLSWNKEETSTADLIDSVLSHVGGVRYIDRVTGKHVIKLLRADYDEEDLLELDDTSIISVNNLKRVAADGTYTSVAINYRKNLFGDNGQSAPVHDEGALMARGAPKLKVIDYPGITTAANADRVAWRELAALTTPLWAAELKATRVAYSLQKGDCFLFTRPELGFDKMVMRVLETSRGDGKSNAITIKCCQDIFANPTPPAIVIEDDPTDAPGVPPPPTTATDDYYTARILDSHNKGIADGVFPSPSYGGAQDSPWCDNAGVHGWTEDPVGVMTRNEAGPLGSQHFDGMDPFEGASAGTPFVSPMIGQTFLVCRTAATYSHQALTGPYVLDDPGGYYDENGAFVATYAKMHRAPNFSQSGDFTSGMIIQVRNGDTYAGDFFRLDTYPVGLGTIPMTWTLIDGPTIEWGDTLNILKPSEIAANNCSTDTALGITGTVTNGILALEDGIGESEFNTLATSPNVRSIPAGTWKVFPCLVSITGASTGSVTTFGVQFYRVAFGAQTLLFEILSAELEMTPFETGGFYYGTPAPLEYSSLEVPMNTYNPQGGDGLRVVFTIHTTSTSEITAYVQYVGINAIHIQIPRGKNQALVTEVADEDFVTVAIGDGWINPGTKAGTVYVTGCTLEGSHFQGMVKPALASGKTRQTKVIFDGPINVDHDASTTGHEAYGALTVSASGQQMTAAESSLTFTWNPTTGRWAAISSWSTAA